MAMSATLQMVGNPIVGQPSTFVLTVSNSGGATVNVIGINPRATQVGAPLNFSPVFAAPGFSGVNPGTNNEFIVPVLASGSATFTFSVVCMGQQASTGLPAQPSNQFYITADVNSDDGSQFAPASMPYFPANAQFGVGGSANNVSKVGQLQFNQGANTVLAL